MVNSLECHLFQYMLRSLFMFFKWTQDFTTVQLDILNKLCIHEIERYYT